MENLAGGRAQEWMALARGCKARDVNAFARAPWNTLLGSEANKSAGGTFSSRTANKLQKPCKTSGWAAVYRLRGGSIRKKVIGHGMRAIVPGFTVGKHVGRPGRSFPLLHKQTGQHGGGVFLHPLIKQGGNFLAEIGCMRQARQFKALQGVPRSGKQKLPRWLGRAGGHRTSVSGRCVY